jgi:hypothetical protein
MYEEEQINGRESKYFIKVIYNDNEMKLPGCGN